MFRNLTLAAMVLALVAMAPAAFAEPKGEVPLIPFAKFWAPGEVEAPILSPDGKWVSYIGRYQDAYNIFVAPIDDPNKARPLTRETGRGIQWYTVSGALTYRWTPDSRYILFQKDNNGDEHNRIYAVDVVSGETRTLTPGEHVRAHVLGVSRSHPNHVLLAVNTELPQASGADNPGLIFGYDVVDVDLTTGAQTKVMNKVPFGGVIVDNDLKPRLGWVPGPDQSVDVLKIKPDGSTVPYYHIAFDDLGGLSATGETDSLRISADNRTLYMLDDVGRDTVAVTGFDLETGAKTVVAADDRVDIRNLVFDPATNKPAAYGVNWTMLEWHALEPSIKRDLKFLTKGHEGELEVASRSADGQEWLVFYRVADHPDTYYAYNSKTQALKELFVTTPQLLGLPLVKMFPYVMKARDGTELVGYYSLPFSKDPNQAAKPDTPAPMIVYVHGGPSDERPEYAYAPMIQYFANRGYGLLYVNFRGGAGFGKKFLRGADMEWGGKMDDDVVDQVKWAIAQGIADPKRIAVLGGSYGGYETLISMTRDSDLYACGIDVVGPSDLSIPLPHWDPNWMAKVLGDPRTPEGQARLKSISPYYMASKARSPILVGQGDQDARVPTAQSDKMVKALGDAGSEVVYLRFPDEGHGFLRPENNSAFWGVSGVFLSKCLGGRSEPLTPELFKGSSVIVAAGADYIPGLNTAIAASRASPAPPAAATSK
jgi:dipeptidyl aminopeptidase/acylaminoacyl peptidase